MLFRKLTKGLLLTLQMKFATKSEHSHNNASRPTGLTINKGFHQDDAPKHACRISLISNASLQNLKLQTIPIAA